VELHHARNGRLLLLAIKNGMKKSGKWGFERGSIESRTFRLCERANGFEKYLGIINE
jgi:hypothetical protein